jgi:hypothetical protein
MVSFLYCFRQASAVFLTLGEIGLRFGQHIRTAAGPRVASPSDPKLDSEPIINMGSEIFAHLANRAHSSLHAAGVASARIGWRPPRSRS